MGLFAGPYVRHDIRLCGDFETADVHPRDLHSLDTGAQVEKT